MEDISFLFSIDHSFIIAFFSPAVRLSNFLVDWNFLVLRFYTRDRTSRAFHRRVITILYLYS